MSFFVFFFNGLQYKCMEAIWTYLVADNKIPVLYAGWQMESLTDACMSDLRPNMQVSATSYSIRLLFFSLNLFIISCFFLHPVLIRKRASVQHTHMRHTLTGRRAQTLEYISVIKNDSSKRKKGKKKGAVITKAQVRRLTASWILPKVTASLIFLRMIHSNTFCHARRKKMNLNNNNRVLTKIKIKLQDKMPHIEQHWASIPW